MEWLLAMWPLSAIAAGLLGVFGIFSWLGRCRHPNPHYRPAVTHRDAMIGANKVVEPASYTCYECGKTWPASVDDPAWAPTGIRQIYAGYDPALAERAATRAAIVAQQRHLLAASRTGPTRSAPVPAPRKRARRKSWSADNVTDINTRRPA